MEKIKQEILSNALKVIGLKLNDKGQVLKIVGEQVPNGSEINDIYYPQLWQHLVSQQVIDAIRKAALEEGVFLEEDWVNGVKEWITNGILQLTDYNKEVTIDDFNPADPAQIVIKFSIDYEKMTSIKISQTRVIQAFTNGQTLDTFISNLVQQLYNTFKKFMQDTKAKIIANDPTSDVTITYDKTFDTTAVTEMIDLIALLNVEVESLKTLSNNHIAISDETFLYSISSLDDLVMVTTPTIKTRLLTEVIAPIYNSDKLMTSLIRNAKIVSFEDAGVDTTLAAGFKFALFDKKALRLGYQIKDANWGYRVPKMQNVTELHNWFGFAVIPTLYKAIWMDVPAPEVAKLQKTKKVTNKINLKPEVINVKNKLVELKLTRPPKEDILIKLEKLFETLINKLDSKKEGDEENKA